MRAGKYSNPLLRSEERAREIIIRTMRIPGVFINTALFEAGSSSNLFSFLKKKYKTAKDYAKASQKTFESEIRSTGFFRNKAKNIIAAAKMIVKDSAGKVPGTMEDLLKLPGVARKTATVILFNAFHKIEGITVDTHVIRLSQRLGLSKNTDPVKIEQDLMKIIPKKLWGKFAYWLIQHGRNVCIAKKPLCPQCVLKKICPSYSFFMKKFYS